jgi:hypothetical protein
MGGLVIDIYIEYLYRVVTRMIRRFGSSAWPVAKGNVRSSACPGAGYGCYVAKVYYTYRVDGEHYAGVNEKPFIIRNSGENYVSRFARGTEFTVRVKPQDAAVSLVRDGDQT